MQQEAEPELRVARWDTLFTTTHERSGDEAQFDVSPDGARFVMLRRVRDPRPPVVVLGWLAEVRETLAAPRR